jgi:aspartyl protease family protein
MGWVLIVLISLVLPALAVERVKVLALFPNKAMLSIDGKNRVLASGETSREGVKLISADPRSALVEFNGERRELRLGSSVAATYQRPSSTEVRIPKALNGSFRTSGWVNGRPVDFLVDTGASGVAMSQVEADRLGIRYRMDGDPIMVSTASGAERGYRVDLSSVRVGEIELTRVQGIVVQGESPREILLGMSFLGQLDVEHSGDMMVLRKKY